MLRSRSHSTFLGLSKLNGRPSYCPPIAAGSRPERVYIPGVQTHEEILHTVARCGGGRNSLFFDAKKTQYGCGVPRPLVSTILNQNSNQNRTASKWGSPNCRLMCGVIYFRGEVPSRCRPALMYRKSMYLRCGSSAGYEM